MNNARRVQTMMAMMNRIIGVGAHSGIARH